MRTNTLFLIPLLAIAVSCGGSGSDPGTDTIALPAGAPAAPSPSDTVVLAKAYDGEYQVPDHFFVDERAVTETGSYSVHHVLDESSSFERCSEDLVEAQEWEASDNASRAVSGEYVTSYENERYFEFVRELSYDQSVGNITDPTSPGYARVFKCHHTNRDGVDRTLLDGYSGRIAPELLNAASLKEFTEYLWQFRFFNARRKVVLESISGFSSGGDLRHTLLLALVFSQGTNACDRVDVVEWRFTADSASREIERDFETVRSFEAQMIGGVAEFCQ